jgi:gluconate 2-dehydrogenase gamma chain
MNRRHSLKLLAGSAAFTAFLAACKNADKTITVAKAFDAKTFSLDRAKEELEREEKLFSETFFTPHELQTITVLCDIIIPKDAVSGSASDAKVPDFIEFIVKDMPDHQLPMRGGLRWVDVYCLKKYNKDFLSCSPAEQMELIDQIAYPEKAKPEMKQGVAFFSLLRNLTASGFYTSKMGIADIGYQGNTANQWNGVPADVLKQYGLAYTEKELTETVQFDT